MTTSRRADDTGIPVKPICTFNLRPRLPEPLKPLLRLAYNLRWSWDHGTIELFRRLDRDLWETSGHNPVFLLGNIDQAQLEAAAQNAGFLAHMAGVVASLDRYLSGIETWYRRDARKSVPLPSSSAEGGPDHPALIAYFSAEFGITECLSVFAGGLGVLAGDHMKAASDLGVPIVGVGLLYQQGYFVQYLNAAGWQQEAYQDNDFHVLPIEPIAGLKIAIDLPEGPVVAQVWKAEVGRLQLYLLDTNLPENGPYARDITDQLYGGGLEMRIKQEILLGIGGYRALEALGLQPTVYHMNEGHSAFLALERVLRLMETYKLNFYEARMLASASLVFTGHTPVPAGHDRFSPGLIDRYLGSYAGRLGISRDDFLGLGRVNPKDSNEEFCMTVLALRLAAFSNGVSKLHGEVSRQMWRHLWPGVPLPEIPIRHVTNGVHFRTWVSNEMNQLYDRYLSPKWREEPADRDLWRNIQAIPAEELWRTHERRRERLVNYARKRLREQLINRGSFQADIEAADEVLHPDALTIGFGRRFATYKRATLLLQDPERLARLLNDPQRPVQVIYAGKAHPHDAAGKELIQSIVSLSSRPEFRRRIVFLENYDMAVARYMVQGCDVWLNTPLRPLEASGTSGMKALANGVLNLSTLDGWWDEAWHDAEGGPDVGWAIGKGESYDDPAYQDRVEAEALYELLEREIVPKFYEHRKDGLPRAWVAEMKSSLTALCPEYTMHRQVKQYTKEYYEAAHARFRSFELAGAARAKNLAAWVRRVRQTWPQLRVQSVEVTNGAEIEIGSDIQVRVVVFLGPLNPEEVSVEAVLGRLNAGGRISDPVAVRMQPVASPVDGLCVFAADLQPAFRSGMHGLSVRLIPCHPDLITPFLPGLITWAEGPR